MKSFDEIYALIVNENYEMVNKFSKTQNSDKKLSNYANIITLILAILFTFIIFKIKLLQLIPFFLVLTIVLRIFIKLILGAIFGLNKEKENLNLEYKNNIIYKLISNIYKNAEYFPNKELSRNIYKEAKFESYDRYYSNDYIEGSIDNNLFQMANIRTEEEYKDKDGDTHTRVVFSGIYAKIDIDRKINTNMRIQSSCFEYIKNKVKLDYPLFEKYFNVSSKDSVQTMQILTSDVMDYIVELRKKINMDFDIVIENNTMYIRIHSGDVFDLNDYKKDLFDRDALYKNYVVLAAINDLFDNLNKVIL